MKRVLLLCTGNSARSILGEAMLNHLGEERFMAFSAGSKPKGVPHPGALRLLSRKGIATKHLRSKSWDEFSVADAPALDIAITVCSDAAGETCPLFLGAPIRAHWGLPDPADATGDDAHVDAAFEETWRLLEMRVRALLALPVETMIASELKTALTGIGKMEGAA
jgi:arsenate reductase (thioredoxin)